MPSQHASRGAVEEPSGEFFSFFTVVRGQRLIVLIIYYTKVVRSLKLRSNYRNSEPGGLPFQESRSTSQFKVAPPQHFLCFFPEPHGHGSFRPTWEAVCQGVGALLQRLETEGTGWAFSCFVVTGIVEGKQPMHSARRYRSQIGRAHV